MLNVNNDVIMTRRWSRKIAFKAKIIGVLTSPDKWPILVDVAVRPGKSDEGHDVGHRTGKTPRVIVYIMLPRVK